MRIFKSFHLIPHRIQLLPAIVLDLVDGWRFVDALAFFENLLPQILCIKIRDFLSLPHRVRIKDLLFSILRYRLTIQHDHISQSPVAVPVKETIYGFESRIGDLLNIFTDLDLRDQLSIFF